MRRLFQMALLISFLIHGGVLYVLSKDRGGDTKVYIRNKIEIAYQYAISEKKSQRPLYVKKNSMVNMKDRLILEGKRKFMTSIDEGLSHVLRLDREIDLGKRYLSKHSVYVKKNVKISFGDGQKIGNPKYKKYYYLVSSLIKKEIYYILDESKGNEGEIDLHFWVNSDGRVIDAKVGEDRGNVTRYLKDVVLKSIYRAEPFPPFPKGLEYPEVPFTVRIHIQS